MEHINSVETSERRHLNWYRVLMALLVGFAAVQLTIGPLESMVKIPCLCMRSLCSSYIVTMKGISKFPHIISATIIEDMNGYVVGGVILCRTSYDGPLQYLQRLVDNRYENVDCGKMARLHRKPPVRSRRLVVEENVLKQAVTLREKETERYGDPGKGYGIKRKISPPDQVS